MEFSHDVYAIGPATKKAESKRDRVDAALLRVLSGSLTTYW